MPFLVTTQALSRQPLLTESFFLLDTPPVTPSAQSYEYQFYQLSRQFHLPPLLGSHVCEHDVHLFTLPKSLTIVH